MFPFTMDLINSNKVFGKFEQAIDLNRIRKSVESNWVFESFAVDDKNSYNLHSYYYENVRDAIVSAKIEKGKRQTVYNYQHKSKSGYYAIRLLKKEYIQGEENILEKVYILEVEKIILKLYETGIGIISLFLNNTEYTDIDDINSINDRGRRIYPPFLSLVEAKKNVLADRIIIELVDSDKNVVFYEEENFEDIFNKLSSKKQDEEGSGDDCKNNSSPIKQANYISKTIMRLLGNRFKVNGEDCSKGDVIINPIIDDRMYTMCLFYNNALANQCKVNYKNSENWYKYIFIDGDGLTCQSDDMMERLLMESTYDRWIKYGTLYGTSRYSFMVLSGFNSKGKGDFSEVIYDHFTSIYFEMVCLVLCQRASILRFSKSATEVAALNGRKQAKATRDLLANYICFTNKIYFREATAQDQGIELYEMITKKMLIERDIKSLDQEIDELHRYASMVDSENTAKALYTINIIASLFVIPSFIITIIALGGNNNFPIGLDLDYVWWNNNFPDAFKWFSSNILLPSLILYGLFKVLVYFRNK